MLGLFREGHAANSPFYGFLALYNALDAAFDNNERQRNAFIDDEVVESATTAKGWADFLQEELRNAADERRVVPQRTGLRRVHVAW